MSEETKEIELRIKIMSDGLRLMAFSAFVFVCMCALFVSLIINPATEYSHIIIAGAGFGITMFTMIYMTFRYFSEKIMGHISGERKVLQLYLQSFEDQSE